MLVAIIIIIIVIICVVGALIYLYIKNKTPVSESTNKMFMEYIGMLNETYKKLTSQVDYKAEFEDLLYEIDKEYKNVLGEAYNEEINDNDITDIKYCINLLQKINKVGFDIEIEENVSREKLVAHTYNRIKGIVSNNVKNIQIAKPLCVLLTIKLLMIR